MGVKTSREASKAAGKQSKARSAAAGLPQKHLLYFAVAALLLAVIICYANSFNNQFVFDDHHLILLRRWPQSLEEFLRMFRYSYRPLREFSYALDLRLWGENPFGFHLTSTLIHAVNVLLVFFLIRRLVTRLLPSFLAALIFAVHPIQTDSVTYISGRRDVLFAMFYLAAFHFYLDYRRSRRRRHLALLVLMWVLSLMSKEMAVSLPLVVFLWSFCDLWGEQTGSHIRRAGLAAIKSLGRDKWLYAPLALAMAAYTFFYVFYKQASARVSFEGVFFWGGSFYSNLLMAFRAQAWYLKQLVFPTPIAQYYGAFEPSASLLEWKVLLAIAVTVSALAMALALLKKNRLMAFAALSHFAMLLPVSQIIPHHEFVADHYLYLPIASFALFVAAGMEMLAARSKAAARYAWVGVGTVIVAFAVMTMLNNRHWKDEFSLWQKNYNDVPRSPRAAANLAVEYIKVKGDLQKAEYYYKQALASDPAYEAAYTRLIDLYIAQKRYDRAEEVINQGLAVVEAGGRSFITIRRPLMFRSQMIGALGTLRKAQGESLEAERLLREAIKLEPDNMEPYAALSNLFHEKDPMREFEVLASVLDRRPRYYEICVRIIALMIENKKYEQALVYIDRALAMQPTDNDCRKASSYLESALRSAAAITDNKSLTEALRRVEQQCAK